MESEKFWQAPEGINEKILMTARPFDVVYKMLFVNDEDFKNNTTVSIANGLSNLVEHINSINEQTHCYGVDPVYSLFGDTYDQFLGNVAVRGLSMPTHLKVDESDYYKIK